MFDIFHCRSVVATRLTQTQGLNVTHVLASASIGGEASLLVMGLLALACAMFDIFHCRSVVATRLAQTRGLNVSNQDLWPRIIDLGSLILESESWFVENK